MPSAAILKRLRAACLCLPEAEERETWGHATFRVREKIYVIAGDGEDGRPRISFKAPPGSQEILIGADPERFFYPPYVGPKGWVGMWLDGRVDWKEVALLVARSYRMTAPKKLAVLLPEPPRGLTLARGQRIEPADLRAALPLGGAAIRLRGVEPCRDAAS